MGQGKGYLQKLERSNKGCLKPNASYNKFTSASRSKDFYDNQKKWQDDKNIRKGEKCLMLQSKVKDTGSG